MPEPTTSAVCAVGLACSVALIEAATGLQVPLVLWAALGGLWAFRWLESMPWQRRVSALALSALIGAVGAIPAALVAVAAARHFLPWWPSLVDAGLVAKPIATAIGLLCHPVIGRRLIELGNRDADGVTK